MGQPITNDVAGSKVTSDTSPIHVDSHTSDRGTWNMGKYLELSIEKYLEQD